MLGTEWSLLFPEQRAKTFPRNYTLKGAPLCNAVNFSYTGFVCVKVYRNNITVRCVACDLQLDGWEPDDDPHVEHERRRKDCPYLIFLKDAHQPKVTQTWLQLKMQIELYTLKQYTNNLINELNSHLQ